MAKSVFILALILVPKVALAYVDPGTGSIVMQFIYSVVAAGLFYFVLAFRHLKSKFHKKKPPKKKHEDKRQAA